MLGHGLIWQGGEREMSEGREKEREKREKRKERIERGEERGEREREREREKERESGSFRAQELLVCSDVSV